MTNLATHTYIRTYIYIYMNMNICVHIYGYMHMCQYISDFGVDIFFVQIICTFQNVFILCCHWIFTHQPYLVVIAEIMVSILWMGMSEGATL